LKDFIPVASLTNQPYVLVAGKPAGITTVREVIAAAKAKPGELKGRTTRVTPKFSTSLARPLVSFEDPGQFQTFLELVALSCPP
jgi:hypothetical protein